MCYLCLSLFHAIFLGALQNQQDSTPIPKPNKDPCIGSSYRPIPLLSPIAKILEKVILPYITANIPDTPHQQGFKSLHSTTIALHQLTSQSLRAWTKICLVVSLDLRKALDTINIHNIITNMHQTNIPPPSSNSQQTTAKDERDTPNTKMPRPKNNNSKPESLKVASYHPPY
jgi:hypothetical protein